MTGFCASKSKIVSDIRLRYLVAFLRRIDTASLGLRLLCELRADQTMKFSLSHYRFRSRSGRAVVSSLVSSSFSLRVCHSRSELNASAHSLLRISEFISSRSQVHLFMLGQALLEHPRYNLKSESFMSLMSVTQLLA